MKKSYRICLIALCAAVLAIAGCQGKGSTVEKEVPRPEVRGVTAGTITLTAVDEYLEAAGTVRAKRESVIASRVMGTVLSVRVKEGDAVKAGQVLLTLDDRDIAQKVRAAEEGYREAGKALEAAAEQKKLMEVTYQRYRNLHDDRAITGQEFDQIETRKKVAELDFERASAAVKRAEAGLEETRVYRGFTSLESPVHGRVTSRRIDAGSMAVPGTPLLTVEDTSAFHLEVSLDEKAVGKVRPGMTVSVFLEALNRDEKGTVSEIVPAVDPATRSFMIKAGLAGDGLKTGMYGRVKIPVGQKEVLLVPGWALVSKGQLTGVFTTDAQGVITYRLVKTGKAYGESTEILSGLRAGEKIIVDGVENAVDGGIMRTSAGSE